MAEGRAKGGRFELEVSRAISVWVLGNKYAKAPAAKLPFRRRSTSIIPLDGHWEGSGDILHRPGVFWPFCCEAKDWDGYELDNFFYDAKIVTWGWWEQAKQQADESKLEPLLIFTRNHRPVYAMLFERVAECLMLEPYNAPIASLKLPGEPQTVLLCTLPDLTTTNIRLLKGRSSILKQKRCW